MLQRPSRAELKRARQQRWRQRPNRGVIHVAGGLPTVLVEALINSRVLDPQAAQLNPYSVANSGRCLGSEISDQRMVRKLCATARMWQHRPMSTEPLAWNEQFAGQLPTAESGNATYYIDNGHSHGVAAYVGGRDPSGGKRGFSLGSFRTIEEARQKCEQHYADVRDVSGADQ